MDVSKIFESLNEAQRKAVSSESQNLLVLAGAGSGKTRVIAHRVAWLIEILNVNPQSILTVTFTNKAAKEMRGRIEEITDLNLGNFWCGTFHGISHIGKDTTLVRVAVAIRTDVMTMISSSIERKR